MSLLHLWDLVTDKKYILSSILVFPWALFPINIFIFLLKLKLDFEIGIRTIILLVGLVLLIFNTLLYISKNDTTKITEIKADKKKEEYDKMEQQRYFKILNLKLTEQELFYIRHALELGFKQMSQDDKETYVGILKMFQEK